MQLSDLAEDVEMQTRNAKQAEHSSAMLAATAINSSSRSSRNTQSYPSSSSTTISSTSGGRYEEKKRLNSMYTQEILPPKELDGHSRMIDQRKAAADK